MWHRGRLMLLVPGSAPLVRKAHPGSVHHHRLRSRNAWHHRIRHSCRVQVVWVVEFAQASVSAPSLGNIMLAVRLAHSEWKSSRINPGRRRWLPLLLQRLRNLHNWKSWTGIMLAVSLLAAVLLRTRIMISRSAVGRRRIRDIRPGPRRRPRGRNAEHGRLGLNHMSSCRSKRQRRNRNRHRRHSMRRHAIRRRRIALGVVGRISGIAGWRRPRMILRASTVTVFHCALIFVTVVAHVGFRRGIWISNTRVSTRCHVVSLGGSFGCHIDQTSRRCAQCFG